VLLLTETLGEMKLEVSGCKAQVLPARSSLPPASALIAAAGALKRSCYLL